MSCEICGNDYRIKKKVEVVDIEDRTKRVIWELCSSCYDETFKE